MGSPSRNVQYHPPRLSEDRLNLPQPHSPSFAYTLLREIGNAPVQQLLGRIPPVALPRTSDDILPAGFDPFAVLRHEGTERLLRRGCVAQPAKGLHRQLDAGYGRRCRLLDFSGSDPRCADRPAPAVD